MPRWLLARPYLLASTLSWINIHRRYRALLPALVIAALILGGLLTLPIVGASLEVIAQTPAVPFLLLAIGCAVLTIRRKTRLYHELSTSWLAPLAASASVAIRMTLAPLAQIVLLMIIVAIAVLAGSLSHAAAVTLLAIVGAGYLAGFLVGWFAPHDKTVGSPDFHYVTIRKPRANWATAPRLTPLSFWAVGQAKVSTKPKVTSRILIVILLGIPMGTPGQMAIAIAAGTWVVWYLLALAGSAARVAMSSARWLSVTTVRYVPFTYALGYRVILAQLWTCTGVIFLTASVSAPVTLLITRKSFSCVFLTCIDVIVACWFAMRRAGMDPGFGRQGGLVGLDPAAGRGDATGPDPGVRRQGGTGS
jgi:hypothetical protein